jgi:hypothetical protein
MTKHVADDAGSQPAGVAVWRRRIRPRIERKLIGAGERPERGRLRRPVEISHRPGETVEIMFGAVVIGVDGRQSW